MTEVRAHAPARIIPPTSGDGPCKTQGTVVMVGDTKLDQVTKVVLTADVNNIWRAEIHCFAIPPEVTAAATFSTPKAEGWLSRLCRWIAGKPVDVTNMDSTAIEYRR